jgi:hypothetical protein
MINTEEINKRLTVIKVLESAQFQIKTKQREDYGGTIAGFLLVCPVLDTVMEKDIAPCNYNREFYGALPTAIDKINDFIKETLQPLINEQKDKITKALQ